MIPIYNNVGRILGHIKREALVSGTNDRYIVMDDSSGDDPITKICYLPKKQIRFRERNRKDVNHIYVVAEHALPDWFWDIKSAVEFKPEHFERVTL